MSGNHPSNPEWTNRARAELKAIIAECDCPAQLDRAYGRNPVGFLHFIWTCMRLGAAHHRHGKDESRLQLAANEEEAELELPFEVSRTIRQYFRA